MIKCAINDEGKFCSHNQYNIRVTHVLVGLNLPVVEQGVEPRGDGDVDEVAPDTDVKMTTEQMSDAFDKMVDVMWMADEDAIRERLLRPFYGSEAENLGATKYQLRDMERWECKELDEERWLPFLFGGQPAWASSLQYRLATGE